MLKLNFSGNCGFEPCLAANAGSCGFEPHRGHKNLFLTFYSIRVKCEELFCKTNIKLLETYIV